MRARITILAGDGIGPEVTGEALRALRPVMQSSGHDFEIEHALIGGAAIQALGAPFPPATREACLRSKAVFLGAVGGPAFDALPHGIRPESGLLQLRQALGGFANLRPARVAPSLIACSPLRESVAEAVNILIVRELLGGAYFGEPRGFKRAAAAFNTMSYSAEQVARVAHVAFREARCRRRKLTSADKANVLETSRLWREVVTEVGAQYPDVALEHMYADACAAALVMNPGRFDVILTENVFGDILSDQAGGLAGSLGLLPSASLGGAVDLYEPVHGSAPDIAGKGIANPAGAILSMAMLLRYTMDLPREAALMEQAVEQVWAAGYRTADLVRSASERPITTSDMGGLVEETLAGLLDAPERQQSCRPRC